jgi:hypothetical protein
MSNYFEIEVLLPTAAAAARSRSPQKSTTPSGRLHVYSPVPAADSFRRQGQVPPAVCSPDGLNNGLADMEFHHFSSQQPFQAANSPTAVPWHTVLPPQSGGSKPNQNDGRRPSSKIADLSSAQGTQNKEKVQFGAKIQLNGGKIQNGVSSQPPTTCGSSQDSNGRGQSAVGWLGGDRGASQPKYLGN